MWRGSMHGSLIWKDCNLLGSFEGTKLPNGWLQGRSISIRQDTRINNNVPADTRGSVLHGHEQCIRTERRRPTCIKGLPVTVLLLKVYNSRKSTL
ncbi:uncharacterized protein LOC142767555 isoform X3 [Rhipicephalus microplus]|uniref:uncharacterized protein LOC142767555 isoform X3 n=1 Tax=Rhipicephalus microplus TaxID=6941 RepID=UPI003F6CB425